MKEFKTESDLWKIAAPYAFIFVVATFVGILIGDLQLAVVLFFLYSAGIAIYQAAGAIRQSGKNTTRKHSHEPHHQDLNHQTLLHHPVGNATIFTLYCPHCYNAQNYPQETCPVCKDSDGNPLNLVTAYTQFPMMRCSHPLCAPLKRKIPSDVSACPYCKTPLTEEQMFIANYIDHHLLTDRIKMPWEQELDFQEALEKIVARLWAMKNNLSDSRPQQA